jgi:hypothetical protein
MQDDEPNVVLVSTSFLIAYAQSNEAVYQLLSDEGAFPRLIDLISSPKRHGHEGIHRLLMQLLYEMSRIQRIKASDLGTCGQRQKQPRFEELANVSFTG